MTTDRRTFLKYLGLSIPAAATAATVRVEFDDEPEYYGVDPGPVEAPLTPPAPRLESGVFRTARDRTIWGRGLPRYLNAMLLEAPVAMDMEWTRISRVRLHNTPVVPKRNRVHDYIRFDSAEPQLVFKALPPDLSVEGLVTFLPTGGLVSFHELPCIYTNGGDVCISFGDGSAPFMEIG